MDLHGRQLKLDPKGLIASRLGSVPVFIRKHIGTRGVKTPFHLSGSAYFSR